jgi:micrococcal nuclease
LAAVSTSPNIACSIVVTYKSGASTAQGLSPKTSDAAGAVSWSWTIGGNTTLGTWPIDVSCGGARAHATFVVQ